MKYGVLTSYIQENYIASMPMAMILDLKLQSMLVHKYTKGIAVYNGITGFCAPLI